jgi:hypothetical protein
VGADVLDDDDVEVGVLSLEVGQRGPELAFPPGFRRVDDLVGLQPADERIGERAADLALALLRRESHLAAIGILGLGIGVGVEVVELEVESATLSAGERLLLLLGRGLVADLARV